MHDLHDYMTKEKKIRDGTSPLQGQAERPAAVQPEEEKAPGRPESGPSVFKGKCV